MTNIDPQLSRRKAVKLLGSGALLSATAGQGAAQQDGGLITKNRVGSADASNTLSYWVLPDQSPRVSDNQQLATVYEDLWTSWAEGHSDFKISLQYQTNLEQMKTKLLQAAARDNAPDMSQVDSFWVPNFVDQLQPVNDAIQNPDDWYGFVKDVVVQDGDWKSVWKNTDCRALYYRQDLMDKYNDGNPPSTWDELIQVGQDISENENMAGYMYNGGKWEATTFDNLAMYWGQGGDLVNDEGAPVLDQEENRQALLNVFNFFKRTIDTGITPQRVVNINDYVLLREAALNDETAMFLGGNWQIANIKDVADEETWSNWKVSKIPQMGEDMSSTGTGGWTEGIFTDQEPLYGAALDFVGQFTDAENMGEYCQAGGYLPTRKSVYDNVEFFSEDPYMQTYRELLQDGRARPGYPIYLTISSEWQVAAGKVITGQASPEQAINTMIQNVNSEYSG
jgi:multiple sugar transport system substrate-binding protein